MIANLSDAMVVIREMEREIKDKEEELETERLRLATCGVVAWAVGEEPTKDIADKYKSDSLDAVLNLIQKLKEKDEELEKTQDELEDLKNTYNKYQIICVSCKEKDEQIKQLEHSNYCLKANRHDAVRDAQVPLENQIRQLEAKLDKARECFKRFVSVVKSINHGKNHEIKIPGDDYPIYPQRKEWVEYLLEEMNTAESVLKEIE
jgi:hypothetical protein